ncbi:noroxomaritidine synthase 2-like [Oryza glaberrima]|nr:noroxomaritidine synthase 2-like [Oryza glaberrima]
MARGSAATSSIRFFITCDPENVRHIFTSNHGNYPKGHEFAEIFDIMAGVSFTLDGEPYLRLRAKMLSVLGDPRLVASMAASCLDKVRDGVLPFLARVATAGAPFDMQDFAGRLMFDVTSMAVFGVHPGYLSSDMMPPAHAAAAMDTVMKVGLLRHVMPASLWKAMRRLNIGPERRLAAAHRVLHGFVGEMMEARTKATQSQHRDADSVDIISSHINDPEYNGAALLQTTAIAYMVAGRDTVGTTLPWFFYNLAMNPHVVSGIRDELAPIVASRRAASPSPPSNGDHHHHTAVMFSPEDTKPLVYLQAALFETLRLYPPGHMERKTAVADDVMPSGHEVRAGDTVLISLYSMGRMESLWGKDCREYRPERWLTGGGGGAQLRHVPSHKFLAFNSGPRMCPGKNIAVMLMKIIAAAVVWNFDLEMVEGQAVEPKMSCLFQMKNGLMLKVKKPQI